MNPNRVESLLVGWDKPLLPQAAEELVRRYHDGPHIEMADLLCVLPTAHSQSRFSECLQTSTSALKASYSPPSIVTVGELPERLYQPTFPLALEFEQTLAWAKVLQETDVDRLSSLIPTPPPPQPMNPWLELGSTVRRLHEELAANNLSFMDVIEHTETEGEKRRWALLADLAVRYRESLSSVGLCDPDSARMEAVHQKQCGVAQPIVLVGTSDLSSMLTTMLREVSTPILSIIAAPPSQANRFDEFGSVLAPQWIKHELPICDEQLIPAGDISDQAIAAVESLGQFGWHQPGHRRSVIGVTDESFVFPIEMELRGCGQRPFRWLGWNIGSTAVGRLFDLVATHLQAQSWQSLAALVRHSHLSRWITQSLGSEDSTAWLNQLDGLIANHFPTGVENSLPAMAEQTYPLAIDAATWVNQWLRPFRASEQTISDQTIAQWCTTISSWLPEPDSWVTNSSPAGQHRRTPMALASVHRLLQRFQDLNPRLDLVVSGPTAMEMIAGRLAELRVVGAPEESEIEILGWLDLALDDADSMTIVGLNQPFVPSSVTSDPFLPGGLRSTLRMADNDRRYARDVYAMHLMISTRQDTRFIVGKTGADGSPTPPSRLIAAAPKPDVARRIRFLLGGKRELDRITHRWDAGPQQTELPIPSLEIATDSDVKEPLVKVMSVTAFRDYLTCPYRFYLRHVKRMKPLDDQARELAANQFGDLVHGALERFGESNEKNESSAAKIEKALHEHLHDYADDFYGPHASISVSLQVAQAELRLKTVALRQAERIDQGWIIHACEASVDENSGAAIRVPEGSVGIRGRFDRIDFHPDAGRWAILDYKTHGHPPVKKHIRKVDGHETWIDLQLPLYQLMIPFLDINSEPSEVELGYFNVSDKDEETKINIAQFSASQLRDARQMIDHCVRGVLREDFEPTNNLVDFDDYAMILQTGVAQRMLDGIELWGQGE